MVLKSNKMYVFKRGRSNDISDVPVLPGRYFISCPFFVPRWTQGGSSLGQNYIPYPETVLWVEHGLRRSGKWHPLSFLCSSLSTVRLTRIVDTVSSVDIRIVHELGL